MIKAFALLIAFVVLSACDGDAKNGKLDVPADLLELRENALNCSRDIAWTHAERSEHCILVAESVYDDNNNRCWKSDTARCLKWRLVHSDILLLYQGAIAESLFEHGKSNEMAEISEGEFWRMIYLDGKTMRGLFERCIATEGKELEAVGLLKVHSVQPIPLQENQRCFRRGYPDFKTKPLDIS